MTAADNANGRHEIIIVRRNHDDDDEGHHGGVWKIAFADFMTAMMCFFLVMWLINAANEQTKAAVASYFNPVKLIDRNTSRKGLQDLGDGNRTDRPASEAPKPAGGASKQAAGDAAPPERKDAQEAAPAGSENDQRLFADPYAVLSEIAADTGTMQNISSKGDGGVQSAGPATGASGGESYRDPFAPDFWSQQMADPAEEASAERKKIEGDPAQPGDRAAEVANPKVKAVPPALEAAPLEPLAENPDEVATRRVEPTESARPQPQKPVADKTPAPAAVKAAAEIRRQLDEAFKPGDRLHGGVSVEATDKGVVIAITDQLDFGMFEVGSALPKRELVLAMEKIGRIVNERKGTISIEGFTDARPYKGGGYDNWRLSTARAHSAYYMLVRAGLDERRVAEVAGFADRRPKNADDPMAAANRRIEILMETGG